MSRRGTEREAPEQVPHLPQGGARCGAWSLDSGVLTGAGIGRRMRNRLSPPAPLSLYLLVQVFVPVFVKNEAPVCVHGQVFGGRRFSLFVRKIPRSGIVGSCGEWWVSFCRTCQPAPERLCLLRLRRQP